MSSGSSTGQVHQAVIHSSAPQRREERTLFFFPLRPFLPPFSSALCFPLTQRSYNERSPAFHLGEKCTPGIPGSPSSPSSPPPPPLLTSSSPLYMHFISARWIPGRKLLSHPEVKRKEGEQKKKPLFQTISSSERNSELLSFCCLSSDRGMEGKHPEQHGDPAHTWRTTCWFIYAVSTCCTSSFHRVNVDSGSTTKLLVQDQHQIISR